MDVVAPDLGSDAAGLALALDRRDPGTVPNQDRSPPVISDRRDRILRLAFGSQPTDSAGTPPLTGDIVGRPEMGQDRELGKAERARLRELASIAYQRELARELAKLEDEFRRWRAGEIDAFGLSSVPSPLDPHRRSLQQSLIDGGDIEGRWIDVAGPIRHVFIFPMTWVREDPDEPHVSV